jgi:hypothetical protein
MPRRFTRRTGQTSLAALVALPLMLGVLVLVLVLYRTRDSLIELRNAGVAASLAGVEELADDDMLTDRPDRVRPIFNRARRAAADVAHQNIVDGRRVELRDDDSDRDGHDHGHRDRHGDRDLTFGTLDRAVGGHFEPFDPRSPASEWGKVNAIEVTVRQPGKPSTFTRVTAVLDSAVIGFRPWDGKPAPVVPVALFADADDEHAGWNDSCRTGRDRWTFDSEHKRFVPGSDGLPEVRVVVGRQPRGRSDDVCGFPLEIGSGRGRDAVQQVRTGLTTEMLSGHRFDGEFKLRDGNVLHLGGDPDLFDGRREDDAERAFRAIVGEPRVWPLFSEFDDDGRAVLIGFTAARVVKVETDGRTRGIALTLQPCVLATPTALTDPGRCDRHGKPVGNRTVVKVRLAG